MNERVAWLEESLRELGPRDDVRTLRDARALYARCLEARAALARGRGMVVSDAMAPEELDAFARWAEGAIAARTAFSSLDLHLEPARSIVVTAAALDPPASATHTLRRWAEGLATASGATFELASA